jgi:DNA transposition AAA+ family ATPase
MTNTAPISATTALPAISEVRRKARDYMTRANLTRASFGRRIGCSRGTLNNFMLEGYGDRYGSPKFLQKVANYIAENPVVFGDADYKPVKIYETEDERLIRRSFYEAFEKRRCGIVQGDPGTGKSEIARRLAYELNSKQDQNNPHAARAIYVYCPEQVTPRALMKLIAEAAGAVSNGDIRNVFKNLRFELRGRRVIILLDEAQHLSISCMETVRELYDLKPHCALLFLGSHDFGQTLTVKALQLEQWNGGRFNFLRSLQGISDEKAREIIRAELGDGVKRDLIELLIKSARVPNLRSRGTKTYISARRLFGALRDLQIETAVSE